MEWQRPTGSQYLNMPPVDSTSGIHLWMTIDTSMYVLVMRLILQKLKCLLPYQCGWPAMLS